VCPYQVGMGMKIFASGRKRCMKSAIRRQLPVPDRLCTDATRPSAMAAAPSPYANLTLCAQNSADPPAVHPIPPAASAPPSDQLLRQCGGCARGMRTGEEEPAVWGAREAG
jgi:hypothetical protein